MSFLTVKLPRLLERSGTMSAIISLTNFWIIVSCLLSTAHALRNITIDNTDSIIKYYGTWEPDSKHLSDLDYGGAHTVSEQSSATATFVFTGVAVYYMSPLWPYAVTSQLILNSSAPVEVDLQDHSVASSSTQGEETVQSAPVYAFTVLENGVHTLVVSMSAGGQYVIVDAFIYTLENDTTSATSGISVPSSSSTSIAAAAATGTSPVTSQSFPNTTAIGVGAGLGGAALLLGLLALWLFCSVRRKRRRNAARALDIDGMPPYVQSASIVGPIYSTSSPTSAQHSEPWSPYSARSFTDPRLISELGNAAAQTSTGLTSDPRPDYYRLSKDAASFHDTAQVPFLHMAPGGGTSMTSNIPQPGADRVFSPAPPAYSDAGQKHEGR